jgi:hypothetical protein
MRNKFIVRRDSGYANVDTYFGILHNLFTLQDIEIHALSYGIRHFP